jgi:hypothetical protein
MVRENTQVSSAVRNVSGGSRSAAGAFALSFAAVLLAVPALIASSVALQGCSSSSTGAGCDSTKCAAQNTCIAEVNPLTQQPETKCRRQCSSLSDPQTGCPANYQCVPDAQGVTYCSANTTTYPPAKGQWGASCNPMKGYDNNADCDAANGFWCNGESPTDGNAYCTHFNCTADSDCAGGYYCGTINQYPNVVSASRKIGVVVKACVKRDYCAPCRSDVDCLPVNNAPSHCVADKNGSAICAPECTSDKGCNTEAFCGTLSGLNSKVCYPRAGVCVGDGGLCAPCHSDGDCLKDKVQGVCVRGEFNTEKSCAVPSVKPCPDAMGMAVSGACDGITSEAPAPSKVGCYGGVDFQSLPKNYCHGYVPFSTSITPGCYSPKR